MVSEETPPNVVNSEMHYEQCYMASPCYRNWKSDSHVAYPAGTNGYKWGMCRERALRDAIAKVEAWMDDGCYSPAGLLDDLQDLIP